jgi:hypothetical protein
MKASARSFGHEFDEEENRGVEDHSLTRDDSLDENQETHVSANNRAHGITIDEENESADDVRAAQHVAASERLAKVSLFLVILTLVWAIRLTTCFVDRLKISSRTSDTSSATSTMS